MSPPSGYSSRVYPRVCGGTQENLDEYVWGRGLSPRVRGNQRERVASRFGIRSIPACAGEPIRATASCSSPSVYPRVCGGTKVTGL